MHRFNAPLIEEHFFKYSGHQFLNQQVLTKATLAWYTQNPVIIAKPLYFFKTLFLFFYLIAKKHPKQFYLLLYSLPGRLAIFQ